jgi:hypothetical protein
MAVILEERIAYLEGKGTETIYSMKMSPRWYPSIVTLEMKIFVMNR